MFSLWRKARRENSAASRLLGTTSLRFALHGWQRVKKAGAWDWNCARAISTARRTSPSFWTAFCHEPDNWPVI
ncbi:hypothetical protein, partial [Thiolapillus sp.]|uniref:hypothetical protein n=1 Tax=Thiolapillus sp. TaxID=2017437 RepID=UPI0025CF666A